MRHEINAAKSARSAYPDRSAFQRAITATSRRVFRCSQISGLVVACAGVLVLSGWYFDLQPLKSFVPGMGAMKANSALGFVLMGVGVLQLQAPARWLSYSCGVATALSGCLHVAEYLFGVDLGIDQWLVRDVDIAVASLPGRMSMPTAVGFIFTGAALCLLRSKHAAGHRMADVMTAATAVMGVVALSGYLYQAPALYRLLAPVAIAMHSALLFVLIAFALLTAPPFRGVAAILTADDVGGALARALLPTALLAPVLFGWLRLFAQHHGVIGAELGVALITVANILVFVAVVLRAALTLGATDVRRRNASRLLHESERGLGLLIHSAHDYASFALDREGSVSNWNEGAQRIHGYTAEQILGRHFSCFYTPELIAARVPELELARAMSAGFWEGEGWRTRQDGARFWASVKIAALRDEHGALEGFSKITQDVTERKRFEATLLENNLNLDKQVRERTALLESSQQDLASALRETKALFSAIHQHAIVSVADRSGKITEANDAFCRISGYTRDELLGQDHRIVNSGVQDRSFWLNMWRTIVSGKLWRHEVCNRATDGSLYWVDTMVAPFLNDRGEIAKYVSVGFDVTAAKRAEMAVQALARQLKIAQRITRVGSWELEVDSGRESWSAELFDVMGLAVNGPAPDVATRQALFTPESWARLTAAVDHALASGESYELSLDVVRANDGSSRVMVARGEAVVDVTGKVQRLIGTVQDVTERERVAGEVRRLSERLALATSSANMGVWDWSVLDNVLVWDATMHRLYGTAPASFSSAYEDWRTAVHPDDTAAVEAALNAALSGTREYDATFRIRRRDGATRYLRGVATVYRDAVSGKPLRLVGVNWDITEQRAAENSLVDLNRQLAERSLQANSANTAKSIFLANMSHEIRTPINAVVGLTYLLEQSGLDAEQLSLVRKVKLASRSLLGVVNNVLDLTKIEAGEMDLEETTFLLLPLLEELVSVLQVQASFKGIQLLLQCEGDLPAVLRGDGLHLEQILMNLLSNAIKFTQDGGVRLSVSAPERSGRRTLVRFAVADTGIGIEPAVQARLFAPFTQADSSTTRRFGGTGLGLSIVKRLVTLMDGEISVTSSAGVGSEFVVALPFWVELAASGAARPLEVLVAGDDRDFCAQLAGMACALGWRATTMEAGLPVLECLNQRSVADARVEVLILAYSASDLASTQTVMALQEMANETQPAVVLASSDSDRLYDPALRDCGIALSFLRGGLTTSAVFNAVQEAVGARAHTETFQLSRDADLGASGLQGKHLLVVDDSDINLEVASRILELEGARVTSMTNGQQAVDLLRERPNAFDAILMDVQMPIMDGITATIQIRAMLGLTPLPIIALTAGALLGERQRATDAGMDDFISKPFEPRAMIRKLVRRLSGPATGRVSQQPAARRSSLVPADWPMIDGVDTTCAFSCVVGDKALLIQMLRRLFEHFADLEVPMERARQRQDAALLAARLHRLSGTAGTLGALELGAAAAAWEHALRSQEQEQGEDLGVAVVRELRRLHVSVAPLLAAAGQALTPIEIFTRDARPVNVDLGELIALLERQSFRALEVFVTLTPALQVELSEAAFAAIQRAVHAFEYEGALQLLRSAGDRSTKQPAAAAN